MLTKADEGGGVQKPSNLADIICEQPLRKGSKTPGTETFRWGGTPPGASTDEIFPKS